jgi:hypothetical protein
VVALYWWIPLKRENYGRIWRMEERGVLRLCSSLIFFEFCFFKLRNENLFSISDHFRHVGVTYKKIMCVLTPLTFTCILDVTSI